MTPAMAMERSSSISTEAGRDTGSGRERLTALGRLRARVQRTADSDEPRYSRLRAAFLDALAAGDWSPAEKLPPETEIAKAVGLSLGTVQKALARLASDRVLVRRHGHGTFVSGEASHSNQLLHFRFVGDDGSAIVPVYAEALDRCVVRVRGPWSEFLQASSCIRIRRRINVADEFDCISEYYIDADKFAAVLELPLSELDRVIIRNLLANRFNAPALTISQRIAASSFSPGIQKLLKRHKQRVPGENAFGIVFEIFSYTHHRAPVSFQRIFIPAGVRQLEIPSPHLR